MFSLAEVATLSGAENLGVRRHAGPVVRWVRRPWCIELVGRDQRRNGDRRHLDRRAGCWWERRLGRRPADRRQQWQRRRRRQWGRDRHRRRDRQRGRDRQRRRRGGVRWRGRTRWRGRNGKRRGRRRDVVHRRQRKRGRVRERRWSQHRHVLRIPQRYRHQLHEGDAPCAITQAQTVVRGAAGMMNSDLVVELADGTYRLTAPLVFTVADSGTNGHTITWQAATGANPVLSGGRSITGWSVSDSSKNIWKASASGSFATRATLRRRQDRDSRPFLLDQPLGHDPHDERLDVFEQQPELFEHSRESETGGAERHRIVDQSVGSPIQSTSRTTQ